MKRVATSDSSSPSATNTEEVKSAAKKARGSSSDDSSSSSSSSTTPPTTVPTMATEVNAVPLMVGCSHWFDSATRVAWHTLPEDVITEV
jgi:hypothetical protein